MHRLAGLVGCVAICWRAAPRALFVAAALQLIQGASMGLLILQIRNLLQMVIQVRPGEVGAAHYMSALLPLGIIVAIQSINNIITIYQNEQQQLLTESVQRYTVQPVMQVAAGVELREFETPSFHNRLALAKAVATTKPQQVTMAVLGLARGILNSLALGAALIVLSWPLFLITVLGLIPLWFTNALVARGVFKFLLDMTTNDRLRAYMFEVATGAATAKEVRAFGLGAFLRQRYDELTEWRIQQLRSSLARRTAIAAAGSLGTVVIGGATIALVAWLLLQGQVGLPQAVAALAASLQLSGQLQGMVASGSQLYQSSLFVDQLNCFLASVPKVKPSGSPPMPPRDFTRIQLRDVHFRYPRQSSIRQQSASANRIIEESAAENVRDEAEEVLHGVSMEIRRGEVIALVGDNGSGKTTIAKLLSGLYRPNPGEILWDEIDVSQVDLDDLREHVTTLFQDFARYMLTVRENIGLGRVSRREDESGIKRAAQLAGASEFIEHRPKAYDTLLGTIFPGGDELSGGQWQRIALARAFFRNAPLIVLDEPTASLDPKAETELFDRVRELFADRSVLLISHRLMSVRTADRIYVLQGGRVVEAGTHMELMARDGVYAEMFTLQTAPHPREDLPNIVQLRDVPPPGRVSAGNHSVTQRNAPGLGLGVQVVP